MSSMEEKVAKLPTWARNYVRELKSQASPENARLQAALRDIANLERQVKRLKDRCGMMEEILTCASRGGHETSAEFVNKVIANWSSDE